MKHNQVVRSDQAQTKACPSGKNQSRYGHCIGSDCMAWRWFETHVKDASGELVLNGETYGYCGLAGVP